MSQLDLKEVIDMRTSHWKLFPGFLAGLLVMLLTGCALWSFFGAHPAMMKLHWIVWLLLTVLFPVLALFLHGRGGDIWPMYLLSYLLNAVGAGCAYGVALAFLEVPLRLPIHLAFGAAIVFPAAMAVLMCLVFTLCRRDKIIAMLFTFLSLVGTLASFLLLAKWSGYAAFGACFGFLFLMAFPIACGKVLSAPHKTAAYLSLSGFGVYLIVLVGAVLMLLEDGPGELFEGLFDGIADVAEPPVRNQKNRQPRV